MKESASAAALYEPVHTTSSNPPTVTSVPYVGLRAYEEHEAPLFFGRDAIARQLQDEILGSPVTILFAPSGAGKSSLLKAKVIPGLRNADAHIVYVDGWTAGPLESIQARLLQSLPGTSDLQEAGSLLENAQAIHRQSGRGLVLILDQFEQVLLRHPEEVDKLGQAISALARFSPDAHIVFALREEYLGHLDALRPHLLNIVFGRHRLQPLSEDEARKAIAGPLADFDGRIDADLVERLLKDLRFDTSVGTEVYGGEGKDVSLPFLQIVCSQLWDGAPDHVLTTALYEALGQRRGIVQSYVDSFTRDLRPDERIDMARILNLLAPKAGVKMAYPIDVLAAQTGLSETRVNGLIVRLEEQRVLRRRREGKIVEIFHDAFSEVLRGFIDEVYLEEEMANRRRKRRQRLFRTAFYILIALLSLSIPCSVVFTHLKDKWELLSELGESDCQKVLNAVRRLTSKADTKDQPFLQRFAWGSREEILQSILNNLRGHESTARTCAGLRMFPSEAEGSAQLTVRYNDEGVRPINPADVQGIWSVLAERYWDTKARRIPPKISVVSDRTLPAKTFALADGQKVQTYRALLARDDQVTILAWERKVFEEDLRDFSSGSGLSEERLPPFAPEEVLLAKIEGWSAPLWKVISERRVRLNPGGEAMQVLPATEAVIAVEAFRLATSQPAHFLTENLVRALLLSRQKNAPCLIHAALDRFDECPAEPEPKEETRKSCRMKAFDKLVPLVRESLVETVQDGYRPGTLGLLLDQIADAPASELKPTSLAKRLREDAGRSRPPQKLELSRRRQISWGCWGVEVEPMPDDYDWELASLLEEGVRPIVVRVGARASNTFGGDMLGPEILVAIEQLRSAVLKRYGVVLPGIVFRREAWSDERFRVDVPGRDLEMGHAYDWGTIVDRVRDAVWQTPMTWVSIDQTVNPFAFQGAKRMYLYGWFESRYSRNDVKLLLRSVLGSGAAAGPTPEEWTIRYQMPWLLASLPFWAEACGDSKNGVCLVDGLRATQRARLQRNPSARKMSIVDVGIQALERDDPDAAGIAFRNAMHSDRALAQEAFLSAYAKQADVMVRKEVAALCEPPEPGAWHAWGGGKRSDLIEAALDMESDDARKVQLRLCAVMDSIPSTAADRDAAAIRDFIRKHPNDRSQWSARESYWLGYRLLEATAKMATPKAEDLTLTRELLMVGLRAESGAGAAASTPPKGKLSSQAFHKLRELCKRQGQEGAVCVWNLMTLAEAVPNLLGAHEIVDLVWDARAAVQNLTLRHVERLEHLAKEGVTLVAELPAPERTGLKTYYEYMQLILSLDRYAYLQKDSDALLARVQGLRARMPILGIAPESSEFDVLATILQYNGQQAALEELVAQRKDAPPGGDSHNFMVHLDKHEIEKAAELADLKLAESGWRDAEWHFKSALMHLLINDDSYESSTRRTFLYVHHQYRDYLRLMLWWRFMQQGRYEGAKALLQERLLEVPADDKAKERLDLGDLGPWRERLIHYFLEPESASARAAVFDPMDSEEAFRRSDLIESGQSYQVFRCERFFYDALLQAVTGPEDSAATRCEEKLKAVRDEACFATYEYSMANILLQHKECQVGRGSRTQVDQP